MDSKIELAEAPETFEDGRQVVVNELKELNLELTEGPLHVYVSVILMSKEEEEEYLKLLAKYKHEITRKCLE